MPKSNPPLEDSALAQTLPPPNAQRIKPVSDYPSGSDIQYSTKGDVFPSKSRVFPYAWFLMCIWVLGMIILGVRLINDYKFIRQILSKGTIIKNSMLNRVFDAVVTQRQKRREVRLIESDVVNSPMTVGILRPVILLPKSAYQWQEEQLKATFLHELAHIDRYDYLTYVCAQLVCIVYWMNPLSWMAKAQLSLEQEKACDDDVVRHGMCMLEYAEHLLSIARWANLSEKEKRYHAIGMAKEPILKSRVRSILSEDTSRSTATTGKTLFSMFVVLCMVLPIAAMTFDAKKPDEVYLWYEAEEGELTRGMSIKGDEESSGFMFVEVPPDESQTESSEETLTIQFEVAEAGEYVIWEEFLPHPETKILFLYLLTMENGFYGIHKDRIKK